MRVVSHLALRFHHLFFLQTIPSANQQFIPFGVSYAYACAKERSLDSFSPPPDAPTSPSHHHLQTVHPLHHLPSQHHYSSAPQS